MTSQAGDIEDIAVQECPSNMDDAGKAEVCVGCPGRELCLEGNKPDPDQKIIDTRLRAIKHKILVLSGKGGVGKSSLAVMIAQLLASNGKSVGVLDVDVCGPSIPLMMGVADQPVLDSQWGWKPVVSPSSNIKTLSVGSLLASGSQAVVWRGPRKTSLIRRMVKDTLWGRLDYLIVDTPPGTSDEHLSIVKLLAHTHPEGAIIVTSPQKLATGVVSREIRFCQKLGIPILGLVENMSGFRCPCCSEVSDVFSSGGGEYLSVKYGVPLLGTVPLEPQLTAAHETGSNFLVQLPPHSPTVERVREIVVTLQAKVEGN
ncbi:hypothetical protein Pcinc_022358 [Petrolisthes cinctipes]|uniref:AAA+ ATPase domain-containing protein n=1 Tax=Petrolisthes cinctipes TaxID=88211 RepID=A0AAE1FHW9_PETCI|nr:hypothetical protein Pcinc_022358 [Petrolisthes cinctipes]